VVRNERTVRKGIKRRGESLLGGRGALEDLIDWDIGVGSSQLSSRMEME